MKTKMYLALATVLCFYLSVNAQLIFDRTDNEYLGSYLEGSSPSGKYTMYTRSMDNNYVLKATAKDDSIHIKMVDRTGYKMRKNGQRKVQNYRQISQYDQKGYLLQKQKFGKKKEKRSYSYSYNDAGLFTNYMELVRGSKIFAEQFEYDQNNNLTEYQFFINNEFKSKVTARYNDTIIVEQAYYRNNPTEIRSNWEYEYYFDNQKKETRFFFKNELRHKWTFSCDEEGKDIIKKGESQICELKQYNADSTYVVIKRTYGKKGRISKQRSTFDKFNRLILQEYENVKGKITYKHQYFYNDKNLLIKELSFKRGKHSNEVLWGNESEYTPEGHLAKRTRIRNGKVKSTSIYERNDKGQIISEQYFNKNGEQVSRTTYEYDENGLLTQQNSYNKKDILTHLTQTKYWLY
ncbi:MAG: hypothetical protein JXR60_03070 [Bacteroidales bacterium]|nr:hypothetical protein [Bacteroidales bacterium]